MNKTDAVAKTIQEIEKLRNQNPQNRSLKRFCKSFENILTKEDYINYVALYNHFDEIKDLLDRCNLDKIEKGYIFHKLLKAHFIIIDTYPYSVTNVDNIRNDFIKYGLSEEEVSELFLEYGRKKQKFSFSLKYIKEAQLLLKEVLNPKIILKVVGASLRNGFDIDGIKVREKEMRSFFKNLNTVEKNYKSLKRAIHTTVYMIELKKLISAYTKIPLEESEELIYQYILDPSLKEYQENKLKEFKNLVLRSATTEEENRIALVEFYKSIKLFMEKEKREVRDYHAFGKELLYNEIPSDLVECLLLYYLDSEKIIEEQDVKTESQKSKKQLKRELAMYYEENKKIPFDYHNLGKILKLLQESNYADSVKTNILNGIWQNKIENEAYYAYLLEKNRWNKTEKAKTEEIVEILELMCYAENKEEWEYYHDEALKICRTLDCSVACMDYEMNLMRKK